MGLTSSKLLSITGSGTTLVGLLEGNIKRTIKFDIDDGASPYTHTVRVGNFGCVDGEDIFILGNLGATTNPTINIVDAWSGVTIATFNGTGTAKTSTAWISYFEESSSWELNQLS